MLFATSDLRSSGMLRSTDLYLLTDVSGQTIGTPFKGQAELLDPWKCGLGSTEWGYSHFGEMGRQMTCFFTASKIIF